MSEVARDPASWRRYDLLRTDAADYSLQTDMSGVIVWVSQDLAELTGYEQSVLRGRSIDHLVAPRDIEKVAESRGALGEGAAFDETAVHLVTSDSSELLLALRTVPVHDRDGALIGLMKTFVDLAEHSAVLRALVTLSRCSSVMLRANDESALLQNICDSIVDTGGYTLCWYGHAEQDESRSVTVLAHAGAHREYVANVNVHWDDSPQGNGPTGTALKTRTTQVCNDLMTSEDFAPWRAAAEAEQLRASITIPVFVDDEIDGGLVVYAEEVGAFDALARGLFEDLATDLGYVLERLRQARA